jgi:hypothetical protein
VLICGAAELPRVSHPMELQRECNEGYIKWLHNVTKAKSVGIDTAMGIGKEDRMVYIAKECNNEG